MSQFDFEYLNPKDRVREFEITQVRGRPVLHLTCGHPSVNPAVKSELIKLSPKRAKKVASGKGIEGADVPPDMMYRALSRAAMVGWENVRDADGIEVPFSPDAAFELLSKLPEWIMVRVLRFWVEPDNFHDPEEPIGDVDELVGK